MDKDQHGSRRGKSCHSKLLTHHDIYFNFFYLTQCGNIHSLLKTISLKKNFTQKLVEKMKSQCGIEEKLGKRLQDLLENRKHRNKI